VVRTVELQQIISGTRWTRQELTDAVAGDPEISGFYREVLKGTLPMEEGKLEGASAITKSFHAQWERYEVVDGIMYQRWWDEGETRRARQIVLLVQYREEAMRSAHASISGGHMGVKKTKIK